MIVSYAFSDKTDTGIDAIECATTEEVVAFLAGAIETLDANNELLKLIKDAVSGKRFNEALAFIDEWNTEFCSSGMNLFLYTIKE